MEQKLKQGIVMQSTGSWYQVLNDSEEIIKCRIKGKFRIKGLRTTNPIAVGDYIQYEVKQDGSAIIRKIGTRKNVIVRKSVNLSHKGHIVAANIDRAFLIVTLAKPTTTAEFIDRFLVAAESYNIAVTIVFNKIDIYTNADQILQMQYIDTYTTIGYECLSISAHNMKDIEFFQDKLSGQVNLLSGHSGVGKSTLVNAIEPGLELKVGDISEHYGDGKHTTTFAEMFHLTQGGFIIDTPGIKGFGIINIEKEDIADHFPEMANRRHDCKFSNCIHINEPECAIKQAIEQRKISITRYNSYLSIYNTNEVETYR